MKQNDKAANQKLINSFLKMLKIVVNKRYRKMKKKE